MTDPSVVDTGKKTRYFQCSRLSVLKTLTDFSAFTWPVLSVIKTLTNFSVFTWPVLSVLKTLNSLHQIILFGCNVFYTRLIN
jgi:hypothetical protein